MLEVFVSYPLLLLSFHTVAWLNPTWREPRDWAVPRVSTGHPGAVVGNIVATKALNFQENCCLVTEMSLTGTCLVFTGLSFWGSLSVCLSLSCVCTDLCA